MTSERANNRDIDTIPMPQRDLADGKELTAAQRVAEATHGVATIPNVITAAGVAGVAYGCAEFKRGHRARGIGIVAASAICDLADGYVARKTRVANYRVGRWADIAADGVKAAMVAEAGHSARLISTPRLAAIYGPKVANWVVNGVSQFALGQEAKTTGEGKLAEASRWVALGTTVAGAMMEQANTKGAKAVRTIGAIATAASFMLGLGSIASYLKEQREK